MASNGRCGHQADKRCRLSDKNSSADFSCRDSDRSWFDIGLSSFQSTVTVRRKVLIR